VDHLLVVSVHIILVAAERGVGSKFYIVTLAGTKTASAMCLFHGVGAIETSVYPAFFWEDLVVTLLVDDFCNTAWMFASMARVGQLKNLFLSVLVPNLLSV
jgi:hypothetical protein